MNTNKIALKLKNVSDYYLQKGIGERLRVMDAKEEKEALELLVIQVYKKGIFTYISVNSKQENKFLQGVLLQEVEQKIQEVEHIYNNEDNLDYISQFES